MADVTYSLSEDSSETIFSASTPKGEVWLGAPEISVPVAEAKSFLDNAKEAGLIVTPFP